MQSAATKTRGLSSRRSKSVLGDQEQGSFSIELWKKAFKDAFERLCPIRAGGHECGCLPLLARLVCLCVTIPFLTLQFMIGLRCGNL